MSRFSRDYILFRDYLSNIFPFLKIRFIAINDNYDSINEDGNGIDTDIQFKTLYYDLFSKELSEKVKSSFKQLKSQGKNTNFKMGTHILVMDKGKMQQHGVKEEVWNDPSNDFVKNWLK